MDRQKRIALGGVCGNPASRLKAKPATLSGARIVGLLVLLMFAVVIVGGACPVRKTPIEEQRLMEDHMSGLYFIDAVLMAKRLCPDPSLRWTPDLGPISKCVPLGPTLWMASGTVQDSAAPSAPMKRWVMLFCPGEEKPLFTRVGTLTWGDKASALQRAHGPITAIPGDDGEE